MNITILDILFISFLIVLGLSWFKAISTKKKMEKIEKTTITEPWRFYP